MARLRMEERAFPGLLKSRKSSGTALHILTVLLVSLA